MQDLPFGGQLFGGLGEFHDAKRLATRGVAKRLLGGFGGMLPENFFEWCNLEHISINILLEKCL